MAQVQYYGTGRRKESIARVRLVPGDGKIVVNSKDLEDYFPRAALQKRVREPLESTGMVSRFNVIANVDGGGTTGQTGAIVMGIARALLKADGELRQPLKKGGYLSRDPRMKERRKYGLKKARRAPQWSKR